MPSTGADPAPLPNRPRSRKAAPVIHVVAGLIRHPRKKHKLFFTQRKPDQHLAGLWEFPGGKLEPGESRFHALKRELDEELGITVLAAQPLHAVMHHYPDKSVYLDVWEVLHYKGKAHGREGQKTLWLKPGQIEQYEFPAADEPVLNALKLPSRLLITPELGERDLSAVLMDYSLLMKQRRYPLTLLRCPLMNDRDYLQLALKMQEIASLNNAELIIHRADLKTLQQKRFARFKYCHLNSTLLKQISAKDLAEDVKLSASCHDLSELRQAQTLGCQFALLSTLRETPSHPNASAMGWYGFNHLARQVALPLYALGGVTRKDLALARYQGATGVAGISDFWDVQSVR